MGTLGLQQPSMAGFGLDSPYDPSKVDSWITGILQANKDKQFVNRILNPSAFPNIDLGDGQVGTHLMSWSMFGKDKTPIVYPSIVQDPKSGKLNLLDDDAAFSHAMKTKDYIQFESPEQADMFSKYYKRAWDNDATK